MQIKLGNWRESVRKWESIVQDLKAGDLPPDCFWDKCGYCVQFLEEGDDYDNKDCSRCPLFKKKVCSNWPKETIPYWKLSVWLETNSSSLAPVKIDKVPTRVVNYAKRILAAIMEDDPRVDRRGKKVME